MPHSLYPLECRWDSIRYLCSAFFFLFFSLFQKYFPFLFRGFTPLLKNPPYEGTSFEVSGLQTHRNNPPVHALCAVSVFEAEAHHNLWCWRCPTQGDEVTPAVSLMMLESLMASRCLSHRGGSQVQGLALVTAGKESIFNQQF